ncbi:MAG: hypothetical protein IJ688_11880 [Treponema sp.]|nr:hypothetical protein [Treponema sp.]
MLITFSRQINFLQGIILVNYFQGKEGMIFCKEIIEDFCPPCGVCRQVLSEFCTRDFKIILANGKGEQKVFTLAELLPESFSLK